MRINKKKTIVEQLDSKKIKETKYVNNFSPVISRVHRETRHYCKYLAKKIHRNNWHVHFNFSPMQGYHLCHNFSDYVVSGR